MRWQLYTYIYIYICTFGLSKGYMVVCWGPPKNPYYGDFMLNKFHFGPGGQETKG